MLRFNGHGESIHGRSPYRYFLVLRRLFSAWPRPAQVKGLGYPSVAGLGHEPLINK